MSSPFLRATLTHEDTGSEFVIEKLRKNAPPVIEVQILVEVNGQKLKGILRLEDRGATGAPDYNVTVNAGAMSVELESLTPKSNPATNAALKKLGPEYVMGADGYPILKSMAKSAPTR